MKGVSEYHLSAVDLFDKKALRELDDDIEIKENLKNIFGYLKVGEKISDEDLSFLLFVLDKLFNRVCIAAYFRDNFPFLYFFDLLYSGIHVRSVIKLLSFATDKNHIKEYNERIISLIHSYEEHDIGLFIYTINIYKWLMEGSDVWKEYFCHDSFLFRILLNAENKSVGVIEMLYLMCQNVNTYMDQYNSIIDMLVSDVLLNENSYMVTREISLELIDFVLSYLDKRNIQYTIDFTPFVDIFLNNNDEFLIEGLLAVLLHAPTQYNEVLLKFFDIYKDESSGNGVMNNLILKYVVKYGVDWPSLTNDFLFSLICKLRKSKQSTLLLMIRAVDTMIKYHELEVPLFVLDTLESFLVTHIDDRECLSLVYTMLSTGYKSNELFIKKLLDFFKSQTHILNEFLDSDDTDVVNFAQYISDTLDKI